MTRRYTCKFFEKSLNFLLTSLNTCDSIVISEVLVRIFVVRGLPFFYVYSPVLVIVKSKKIEEKEFSKGDVMRQQWLQNLNILGTKTYNSMPIVSCAHKLETLGLLAPVAYGFIERRSGMRRKVDILRT